MQNFLILLAGIVLSDQRLRPWVTGTPFWQVWFGPDSPGGRVMAILAQQILRLAPFGVCLGLLLILGYRSKDFYLAKGDLNAPAEPVRWLGIKPGDRWIKTGLNFLVAFTVVTFVLTLNSMRPQLHLAANLLPLLPAIVLFAALNAFNENFVYRAALLPTLLPVFGKPLALVLTAALFGLGHLNFTPLGMGALILAGFLGWVLARSMTETGGMGWDWLIQLPQDILSFGFLLLAGLSTAPAP